MRHAVACVLLVLAAPAIAAPAPKPTKDKPAKEKPAGQFEIDFAPFDAIPAGKYEWSLKITLTSQGGKVSRLTITGAAEPGPATQMVTWLTTSRPGGWDLVPDPSGKKLIARGYKGRPMRSVEVSLKGLDWSFTPRVRPVGKK